MFDLGDGTVAKVFRRVKQTHRPVRDWSDHEFLVRQLFATERRAYEQLQSSLDLCKYTPRYLGQLDIANLGISSSNGGEPLLSDCALRLERIDGRDTKIALVQPPLQEQIEAVLERIRDTVGQINVWDCSCFIPGPQTPFTVIDFALWEQWADVQVYLEQNDSIPAAVREQVRVR